jgi:26S proteasome non-ATPase regulatory subunit 9
MENLHAPTVPSGPTSVPLTNGTNTGLSLAQLQAKKDNIEAEIRALSSVLDSVRHSHKYTLQNRYINVIQHGVDMNTRLITPDGFPRADLDVAQSMLQDHRIPSRC